MRNPFRRAAPPPAPALAPFYQFAYASLLPTAGAMAYGFESEMMPNRPMIGPGIAARSYFASLFKTPQAYQVSSMTWQAGLTGVVHGQSALQPLSNPYA
jgi:hypothetical protein